MDYFHTLGLPRVPWVDPELIDQHFSTLSAKHHPDHFSSPEEKRVQEEVFSRINAARQTLRSTKARLAHLLELELGERPSAVAQIPPEAMSLFPKVAEVTKEVDQLLERMANATSPMVKAGFFGEGLTWTGRIQETQGEISVHLRRLEDEARQLNPLWTQAPPPGDPQRAGALPLRRLSELAAAFGFLERWNSQLQEKLGRLAQF